MAAVMTKDQAKKFKEMPDRMIDILDVLKAKGILNDKTHREYLLVGYTKLVAYLEQQKVISSKDAKDAQKNGLDSLIDALAS